MLWGDGMGHSGGAASSPAAHEWQLAAAGVGRACCLAMRGRCCWLCRQPLLLPLRMLLPGGSKLTLHTWRKGTNAARMSYPAALIARRSRLDWPT